jgi:protein-L-isoaspartate(D-aspartate) O-methyltransferase
MYFEKQRLSLIKILEDKGIRSEDVLNAMNRIPRHQFVPVGFESQAYQDKALPIGYGQTISHPYTVAKMTEALQIKTGDKILEVGTGSGYQCAVLCELGAHVFTIEIDTKLAGKARKLLQELGYKFALRIGDGNMGWKEYAPYSGIIVTAAAADVPSSLFKQIDIGGKLLIPIGTQDQQKLTLFLKKKGGVEQIELEEFKFVPLTGRLEWKNNQQARRE